MKVVNMLGITSIVGLVILLHISLLFCTQQHCVVPLQRPPLSAQWAYYLRNALANLLPLSIREVQRIAQWLIVVQALIVVYLVVYFLLKLVKKTISLAMDAALILIAVLLIYKLHDFWQNNPEQCKEIAKRIVQSIYEWVSLLWKKGDSYLNQSSGTQKEL